MNHSTSLNDRLMVLVQDAPWFMAALFAVRELGLSSWCIGAGAVRALVWNHLHDIPSRSSSELADVDVAYFDASDLSAMRDARLQARLASNFPGVPWEVTNQAGVHQWFESHFGNPVRPLLSLEDGISTWPEYATCVGVTLEPGGSLRVIAPHGLDDLFSLTVRWNPSRASLETYRQRVASKKFTERWPKVSVVSS